MEAECHMWQWPREKGHVLWVRLDVVANSGRKTPSAPVSADNSEALADNLLSSSDSKLNGVRRHFLRALETKGENTVNEISSKEQRADILTKAPGRGKGLRRIELS